MLVAAAVMIDGAVAAKAALLPMLLVMLMLMLRC